MAEVFARYPNGGAEMLLALAIADHAHDDGSSVRPSVRHLAEKTRQSERAVQYQLRNMEADGWLELVGHATGGRNTPREYRINPAWVKGADFAPRGKGATDGVKGCNLEHERVQPDVIKGATAIAPEPLNHQGTIEPPAARKRALPGEDYPTPEWVPRDAWLGWLEVRHKKKAPATDRALRTAMNTLTDLRDQGEDPAAVLDQSTGRGWTGLFTTNRGTVHAISGGNRRESEAERVQRINASHDERERRAAGHG